MHILMLSRWFVYPPDNGSKIRIFNLLKGLAANHTVDLITFCENAQCDVDLNGLRPWCHNVIAIPYYPFKPNSMKAYLGFFSNKPRSVIDTYHEDFAAAVKDAVAHNRYDLLIATEIDMAIYGMAIPGVKKILEGLEITKIFRPYTAEQHGFRKFRLGMTWWKLEGYVRSLMNEYDGCTVVSDLERDAVDGLNTAYSPVIIPNGVDVGHFRPDAGIEIEPDSLIYNGAITYHVNFEAVAYFIRDIFPLILAECPGARFYVTGKTDAELLAKLPANPQVFFTGYLDDILPRLQKSSVNVVPILMGGGTRLKILESLAAGLPVVSTTTGAEGLNLEPDRDILIADQPRDFAQAVLRILRDEALRGSLQKNGRHFVETHYDWRAIQAQFETYINQVMGKSSSGVSG